MTSTCRNAGRFLTTLLNVIAAAAFFSAGSVQGADKTWVGNTDTNWNTGNNWSAAGVPAANDALFFGGAGSSGSTLNNDIVAFRQFNGITFNDSADAFSIGGHPIALGGNVTVGAGIATQTIGFGMAMGATREFTVNSGVLALGGVLSGGGGLTKSGGGTLTLAGKNSYAGSTTLSAGTLTLAGGNNTLEVNKPLAVNGGTLELGANNQYVAQLSGGGSVTGTGGTLTATQPGNVRVEFPGTFEASAGLTLVRTTLHNDRGQWNLSLTGVNPTSGSLTLMGGDFWGAQPSGFDRPVFNGIALKDGGRLTGITGITLNNGTLYINNNASSTALNGGTAETSDQDLADRINDAAAITLNGGRIHFLGRASTASAESLGTLTVNTGMGAILVTAGTTGSAEVTLAGLTRADGATFQVDGTNLGTAGDNGRIFVAAALTGNLAPVGAVGVGIVPGVFRGTPVGTPPIAVGYVAGQGFVAVGTAGGPTAYSGALNAAATTDNVRAPSSHIVAGGGQTINSLQQTAAITFVNEDDRLTIASGMLLQTAGTKDIGTAALPGKLTSGLANGELFLIKDSGAGSGGTLGDNQVYSVIADNDDTRVRLVLNNYSRRNLTNNDWNLMAANTYSGGTVMSGGNELYLTGPSEVNGVATIPAAFDPMLGLIVNNSRVTMRNTAQQIAAGNIVTLNGGSILTLTGANNTLAGLVFNSHGGEGNTTPTVSGGTKMTLTGNVSSTPGSVAVTPTIGVALDLNDSVAHDITVAALPAYPAAAGLNISSVIQNGGFTKKGAGVLQLSNNSSTFTGGLNIDDGAVYVSGNPGLGGNGNTVTLGAGALWLGNTVGNTTHTLDVEAGGGTIAAVGGDRQLNAQVVLNGPLTVSLADPMLNSTDRGVTIGAADANTTITGSGSLVVTGNAYNNLQASPKSLYLQNTASLKNTYTSGTTIESGGRMRFNADNSLPLTGSLTIGTGGVLDLNGRNQTVGNFTGDGGTVLNNLTGARTLTIGYGNATGGNFQGVIANGSQAVALTKVGAGELTLSGANTYTGATTVNGGTLTLDYSVNNVSKLPDGAALVLGGGVVNLKGGSHTEIVASVTLNAGSSGVTQTSGTSMLRMGNFTRNVGATLNFSAEDIAGTSRANDGTGILGAWATIGGADWAANSGVDDGGAVGNSLIRAYSDASYTDIAHQGSTILDDAASNVRINSEGAGADIALGANPTTINTLLQNWTSAATVDTAGGALKTTGIMIGEGKEALTIGASAGDGSLSAATSGGDLVLINNNAARLLTVNAPIVASGASTLSASGNVLLNGVNTYTGATGIGGGTLEIGGAGQLNGGNYTGNIAIGTDGTFKYNSSANQIVSGASVISGSGSLLKDGSGLLDLQPNGGNRHTYTGGTVVNGGILRISSNQGVIIGQITINAGGTVEVLQANGLWSYSSIVPPRTLVINGGTLSKTTNAAGNHDYSFASIDMTGGTISSTRADSYFEFFAHYAATLPVTTHAGATEAVISANWGSRDQSLFTFTTAQGTTPSGVDLLFSGNLQHTGATYGVTKAGPGIMVLTGANTYRGTTTISDGTLQLGNDTTTGTLLATSPIVNNATLAFKRSNAITQGADFNSVISGSGGVSQLGGGTLYLTGANTYSGVTAVKAGTLNAGLLANAGSASAIGTGAGGATALVIDGGTLQHTGAIASSDRLFTIGIGGATLDASGTSMTLGSGGGSIAFSSGAAPASLTLTGTGTGVLGAVIPDSGSGANVTSLTKSGAGTWTLTANNTFSDATTISGGTLYLNGANGTLSISVAGGATLGGAGSAGSATVTVAGSGIVEAGYEGAGSLTLAGLDFSGSGTVKASNIGNYSATPAIDVTSPNGLNLNGGAGAVTVALGGMAPDGIGTAHILRYNGALGGGFSGFSTTLDTSEMIGLGGRSTLTLIDNAPYVDIGYHVVYPVWRGEADGTWVTAPSTNGPLTANWGLAASPSTDANFVADDAPLFDDTASGTTTVDIAVADVVPSSVIFDNSTLSYTLQGAYGIAGSGPVIKRGTNVLAMASTNKFTGQLTVQAGTLSVSSVNDANADGPLGNSALSVILGDSSATGTLRYTGAAAASTKPFTMAAGGFGAFQMDTATDEALTLSGAIGGLGGLTKAGDGTLVLSGDNTYGGVTTVGAGILQFARKASLYNGATASWTADNIVVDSGATLAVNVGGTGELTTGELDILKAIGTATGGFKNGSFLGIDNGGDIAYNTVIADPNGGANILGLVKFGAGTLTLGANNTYTGGTVVNDGILSLPGTNIRIRGSLTINAGGQARFLAGWGQGQPAAPTRSLTIIGGTLHNSVGAGNSDYAITSVTMQGGLWSQTGTGYHDFFNTYGNNLPITTLASDSVAEISARVQWRNGNTFTFITAQGTTPSGVDLLFSGQVLNTAIVKTGPGVMALTGANLYTGATTISEGVLQLGNDTTTGTLHVNSAIVNNATLSFTRSNAVTQGADFNSVISGTGGVSQFGGGTLYLGTANTYAGVTTIGAGATLIAGALADYGNASAIGTGAGVANAAALVIDGGTLQHTGATTSSDRLFTIGGSGAATLDASGASMTLGGGGGSLAFAVADSAASLTLLGAGAGILGSDVPDNGSGIASLNKSGNGTWILSGNNTFTGNTTIGGGKLYLNGANDGTQVISVSSGATLGGTGTAAAATTTVTDGGAVEAGSKGLGGLSLGGLNFSGSATVTAANIGNYTTTPALDVTSLDGLSAAGGNGSVTIELTGILPPGTGTAHIIRYNGAMGGTGFGAFVLDTSKLIGASGATISLVNNAGFVDVIWSLDLPVWKGAATGNWIAGGLDSDDWVLSTDLATPTHFETDDSPLFDNSATVFTVNISAADVQPDSVVFSHDAPNDYTLTGGYGIADGTGGGTLVFKTGTGLLTIDTTNKFSGQLTVADGAVAVSEANDANADGPFGNSALPVILGGSSAAGTLRYTGNTAESTKPFTLAGAGGAFDVVMAGEALTLSGAIDGLGGLTKIGAGTLALSGTNVYGGITTVGTGSLQFAQKVSLYNGATASWIPNNIVVDSGAMLAVNVGGTGEFTTGELDILKAIGSASGGFKNGSFLGIDTSNAGGGNFTYGSVIANPNAGANVLGVTKLGTGTLTLSAVNTYTGGTRVDGGTLKVTVNNGIRGTLTINANAVADFNQQQVLYSGNRGAVIVNGGTLDHTGGNGNKDSSFTSVTMTGGVWSFTGAGTGYFDIFDIGAVNPLPITTLASVHTATISARRINTRNGINMLFTVAQGTTPSGVDLLVSGNLTPNGGSGTVTKAGPGLMSFTGAKTYTGATTINGGTLQGVVGGSCASSAVTVAPPASGSASLAVSITDNTQKWTCASLTTTGEGAPGLTFDFGSVTPSETLAPLDITGSVTFASTPSVTVKVPAGIPRGKYPLMRWSSHTGTAPTQATLPGRGSAALTIESDGGGETLYINIVASGILIIVR